MVSPKILLTTLLFFLLKVSVNSQSFESPCPRLFTYTGRSSSEWHGAVTLLSKTDLVDVWVRLTFDRPSLGLENAFGNLITANGTDYFIEKPNFELKAKVPHRFAFILKYSPNAPAPMLLSFKLNGNLVCPEDSQLPEANSASISDVCGTITKYSEAKSVNGEVSYYGAFPWHAAILHPKGKNIDYICAASLISRQFVITVAECVFSKGYVDTPFKPEATVISLGRYYRKSSNFGQQYRNVSQIIPHPQYDAQANLHNVALVKLSTQAVFTDFVRPVCLWQDSLNLSSVINKRGTVVGWGIDTEANITNELIQTKMLVIPQETCKNSVPNFSPDDTYCAGMREGSTVCNADTGAGMVFLKPDSKRMKVVWYLRGLVSVSLGSQHLLKCNASYYVLFTDTINYIDWIKTSIE